MSVENRVPKGAWRIVAACFFLLSVSIGIAINCSGLFLKPICDEFGFSRTEYAINSSIVTVTMLLCSFGVARLIQKHDIRLITTISCLIAAMGHIGYAFCGNLTAFYFCSAFLGAGISGIGMIPCSIMITNWFPQKYGMAMGIACAGSGFGGMIFTQLTRFVIERFGTSEAYLALGVCIALVALPMTLFAVKLKPSKKEEPGMAETSADKCEIVISGLSKQLKNGSFYLLIITMLLIGIINLGVLSQIPAHLVDKGLDPSLAAGTVTIFMLVLIIGKIVAGIILDNKGALSGTIYLAVLFIVSVAILIFANTPLVALVFAVIFGFANPMATVLAPVVTVETSGKTKFCEMYTYSNIALNIGTAIGPPFSAMIFDAKGSYNIAFIVFAFFDCLVVLFTCLLIRNKKTCNL